jgi:hypothetical protein
MKKNEKIAAMNVALLEIIDVIYLQGVSISFLLRSFLNDYVRIDSAKLISISVWATKYHAASCVEREWSVKGVVRRECEESVKGV